MTAGRFLKKLVFYTQNNEMATETTKYVETKRMLLKQPVMGSILKYMYLK